MKVLSIVPDYIDKPSGGLGEQYRNFLNNLKDRVEFFTIGYPEVNSIVNYKSANAPFPFSHAALTTIYGQSIYFLKALEFNQDFDIIHSFDWSTFFAGYLCKTHFNKPLVCSVNLSLKQLNTAGIYYCTDPNSIDGIHINQLQLNFERLGLMCADKVIQVSDYYQNLYPEYMDKTVLIPNGLDIKSWVKKRNTNLPGKNKLKFCYIGRASVMKGLDVILNCNIPDDIDFYFIVSPKNAEEPFFSNIINKCNKKNIFHIPGLYGQDKVDFLFSMDGVVMPSKHEPFGIVALEALISENMLITTASGGIKEIVSDIDYFKIQTSEDLEKTFKKIQTLSEDQIKQIINKGKAKAETFSWSIFSDKLLDVYNELTKKEPTRTY